MIVLALTCVALQFSIESKCHSTGLCCYQRYVHRRLCFRQYVKGESNLTSPKVLLSELVSSLRMSKRSTSEMSSLPSKPNPYTVPFPLFVAANPLLSFCFILGGVLINLI